MSETTAETKAAPKPAKKVNNFTGGTSSQGPQRLTATNLKKMEKALDKKQKSNWGEGERFKDLEKDDRILLNPKD